MALLFGNTAMDGGSLYPVPPNASNSQQITAINQIINQLNRMLKTQYYSDGQTKRMLIGYQKDGWGTGKDFGIKVSIPGVDVSTASDTQLLFKMDVETWYWYDETTGKNYMQVGKMPNNSGGIAVAKPGKNISEIF